MCRVLNAQGVSSNPPPTHTPRNTMVSLHTKFGGPKCKGKETRAKSSKMPPGGAPEAPWGVGGVKYPPYPGTLKLPPHTKFGGTKCKGKETRAKSSKMPPGGAPEAPWGVGGRQIPPIPWNSKVTPTYKICGH